MVKMVLQILSFLYTLEMKYVLHIIKGYFHILLCPY